MNIDISIINLKMNNKMMMMMMMMRITIRKCDDERYDHERIR